MKLAGSDRAPGSTAPIPGPCLCVWAVETLSGAVVVTKDEQGPRTRSGSLLVRLGGGVDRRE